MLQMLKRDAVSKAVSRPWYALILLTASSGAHGTVPCSDHRVQGDFQPGCTNTNARVRSCSLTFLQPPVSGTVCQERKIKTCVGGHGGV